MKIEKVTKTLYKINGIEFEDARDALDYLIENQDNPEQPVPKSGKLLWSQLDHELTWEDSCKFAESLNTLKHLGRTNSRLPTKEELKDAYESKIDGFKKGYYWSLTTHYKVQGNAWFINFDDGFTAFCDKISRSCYVRCVSDGK